MKVREHMTRDVRTASPEDTVQQLARLMAEADTGAIPIVDGDRPVGLVTDRDIVIRALAEGRGPETTASQVMTTNLEFASEDDDLSDVADKMSRLQVRRMLVLDDNRRLCGILSLGDLAQEGRTQDAGEALEQISQPGGQHAQ
jgi:CBS domain-containing protein